MDVTESPIEKPKEGQKSYYSGKQKEHTLKTQIIVDIKTLKIICLASGKGRVHDFQLFKELIPNFKFHQPLFFCINCINFLYLFEVRPILKPHLKVDFDFLS